MKFSEMKYERPDMEKTKAELAELTGELTAAKSYAEAKAAFLKEDELSRHISTMYNLAYVRHSIDTRDPFYDAESKFFNAKLPELREFEQAWTNAMLSSPFRPDFAAEYGDILFVNAEMDLKTFSPEIIPLLQQEGDLNDEYENLLASAQIPFEGKTYTLSQLTPVKTCADDERRLAAWKAEGSGIRITRPGWMSFTISWSISVTRWAESWAMTAILSWATTVCTAIATTRPTLNASGPQCANTLFRWPTGSTVSRPKDWARPTP